MAIATKRQETSPSTTMTIPQLQGRGFCNRTSNHDGKDSFVCFSGFNPHKTAMAQASAAAATRRNDINVHAKGNGQNDACRNTFSESHPILVDVSGSARNLRDGPGTGGHIATQSATHTAAHATHPQASQLCSVANRCIMSHVGLSTRTLHSRPTTIQADTSSQNVNLLRPRGGGAFQPPSGMTFSARGRPVF